MAMRVTYGSRASDLDVQKAPAAARQIARPPCNSLTEAIEAIKADIKAGEESSVPECTTSEITLGFDTILELHRPNIGPYSEGGEHDLPAEFKTGWTAGDPSDGAIGRTYPTASVDAITSYGGKEARAVVQRAASRGIVAAIELADGFKYSMNNAWSAKDADGQRFSYICQDSMQNKDRHANGFTRTLKHLKGEHERGPRKPTYDCKGSVSIKCSMVRRTVDIFYRHYAIHSSVAERRAMPRTPRQRASIGGEGSEVAQPTESGGLLGRLQNEESAFVSPPGSGSQGASNVGRPPKRKRDQDTPNRPGKPPSLVDLLKQSEASEKAKAKPPDKPAPATAPMYPPPMNYDLPSWQAPPPPLPAVKIAKARQPAASAHQPYQPPYQPSAAHQSVYPQDPPQQTPTTARQPSYSDQGHHASQTTQSSSKSANSATPGATPLFTTMKPFRIETPLTLYSGRTRSSCTNCRYGKKKCDEQRPVCGNCAKSGKYDCAYDGAYGYSASAAQQAQMGGWVASQSPASAGGSQVWPQQQTYTPQQSQQQQQQQYQAQSVGSGVPPMSQYQQQGQQGQREESPDPWFPKR